LKILTDEKNNTWSRGERSEAIGKNREKEGKKQDGRGEREKARLVGKARHSKESFFGMFFALIYIDKRWLN
jgi:hypothetical protein